MNLDIQYAGRKGRPVEQTRSFTLQKLCKTMSLINEALEIFSRNDPERERRSRERRPKIARAILSDINCNKEMYLEIPKKSVLQTLDNWLKNVILFTEQEWRGSSWLLWAHFLRSDPLQSVYNRIGTVVNGDQCGYQSCTNRPNAYANQSNHWDVRCTNRANGTARFITLSEVICKKAESVTGLEQISPIPAHVCSCRRPKEEERAQSKSDFISHVEYVVIKEENSFVHVPPNTI
uniref:Uncharacterized protein n=1 Tax=Glossina pallidipes TaxID=7398 RepID=A0A1A9ZL28_GLOPL